MPFLLILRNEDMKYVTSCYYDVKLWRKIRSLCMNILKLVFIGHFWQNIIRLFQEAELSLSEVTNNVTKTSSLFCMMS